MATSPVDTSTTTSSESLKCRNSYDPHCGPIYWDPQPTNQPLVFDASVSATNVRVGEPVAVTVHATDADADVWECPKPAEGQQVSGDSGGCSWTLSECVTDPAIPHPSGPWDPPRPTPSDKTWTYTVTFTTPGVHQIFVNVHSQRDIAVDKGCPLPNPYASDASETFAITVA
jgi:hypothetical protein